MLVFQNRKKLLCITELFFQIKQNLISNRKKLHFYNVVLKALLKNFPTMKRFYGNQLCSHQSPQVVTEKVELDTIQNGEVESVTVVEIAKKCLKNMISLRDPRQN